MATDFHLQKMYDAPAVEKPLTLIALPVNSNRYQCSDSEHYFRIGPVPPGSTCACGNTTMTYEPCAGCGSPKPVLKNVRNLLEGIDYV